jgi:hypothetical protein
MILLFMCCLHFSQKETAFLYLLQLLLSIQPLGEAVKSTQIYPVVSPNRVIQIARFGIHNDHHLPLP